MVGDPGLGKSQLLKAVSQLAPRGLYVSGRSVSKAGLTATVVKDPSTGGWGLADTFPATSPPRILTPLSLRETAFYDVASNIWQARAWQIHFSPRHPTHFDPSFLALNGIL